ncbi:MAG: cation:proton antiporter [Gammaproteobacteria bacterium]|nr:cation:proton antiporter [Gammaproteobacteria bacterium]MDH5650410.1 cation:proton antiporter [Gammaproteobacteria bacterium]
MHLDPALPSIVGGLLVILLVGMILHRLRQPHVVAYLLTGIMLGPQMIGLIVNESVIDRLGAIGVMLLLFFIGMEVSPRKLAAGWRIAVIGTTIQVMLTVLIVWLIGKGLNWPLSRSILLGFVISLSSTAVVLKILQDSGELETETGQNVLGVLLFQDMAIIPMLIIIGLLGGDTPDAKQLILQLVGGTLILGLLAFLMFKEVVHLPLASWLKKDHEMQVFAALIACFGLSLITGLFGLSTALGAFAAGMLIGSARETQWVHRSLEPFRVIFVALFFVSIGMLVDLSFIKTHWSQIAILVGAVIITNTFLNAVIIRLLGDSWPDSLYSGALLSQIGEFSFVLAAVGLQAKLITDYGYQLTVAVIVLSLMVSPAWIGLARRVLYRA